MYKKRILMCGESSHIDSGFGNYTRELLSRLHATDKYVVAELSSYRSHTRPKIEPWIVYPASVDTTDPLYEEFSRNVGNQFGQWRFDFALLDFKPDIVLDIRDFWMYSFQETSPLRPFYYWIIGPTYDSIPQKSESINMLNTADLVVFHTNWAKKDLESKNYFNKINIGDVVSDSVNSEVFKPIGYSKSVHKNKFNIPHNAFIIGSVMRNQKRKLIPELFDVLSTVIKNNPEKEVFLYLHTSYPEQTGWDIPNLLLEYNVTSNVLFTYVCMDCRHHFPAVFKDSVSVCPSCKKKSVTMTSVTNGITQKQLNEIYNLFDVYVQYSICEGFGIPQVEAASCGIPLITMDHGAMSDVGKTLGASIVDIQKEYKELETGSNRVYPNNNTCVLYIQKYLDYSLLDSRRISNNIRKLLIENYSWDKTAKKFEDIFDNLEMTGLQGKWESPILDTQPKNMVHDISNNREFIYYIIDNLIMSDYLKSTFFVEELIRSLDSGVVVSNNQNMKFTKKDALKILEVHLNNKISLEMMRTGIVGMPEKMESFIKYSRL